MGTHLVSKSGPSTGILTFKQALNTWKSASVRFAVCYNEHGIIFIHIWCFSFSALLAFHYPKLNTTQLLRSSWVRTGTDLLMLNLTHWYSKVHYCSKVRGQYYIYIFFLKKLIFLFRKDALNWSNVTVKTFIILLNSSISSKCCSFEHSNYQSLFINPKKTKFITVSVKILSSTTVRMIFRMMWNLRLE